VSQGAVLPRYALSNVARSGASRSNHTSPAVFISIGGVHYGVGRAGSPGVLAESLTITDQLNEIPNTATCTTVGFIPVEGQEVLVTIGSKNNGRREFAGTILSTRQSYVETPRNYRHDLNLIDYTWGLNTKKVRGRYTSTTVAAIAADLLATYTSGYTLRVDSDIAIAAIDEITFTEQDVTDCLTALVTRVGGVWQCTYSKVVRLYFVDTADTPPTLINAVHPTLSAFEKTRDLSQTISRMYVEGGGSNAAADVPVGETILPVTAGEWYEAAGGEVVSGPQRITYTSRILGGTGGLVGPGAAPSAAPVVALASGSGIQTGAHNYAVSFKTASGESLPGPVAALTVGPLAAPPSAPVPGAPQAGSGPDPGSHDYAVTFVTASGETTPGPRVTAATGLTPPPTDAPQPTVQAGTGPDPGSHDYTVTFGTASGETTPGPIGGQVTTSMVPGYTVNPPTDPTTAQSVNLNASDLAVGDHVYYGFTYLTAAGETTVGSISNTITIAMGPTVPNGGKIAACPGHVTGATALKCYRNRNGAWDKRIVSADFGMTVLDNGLNNQAGSPPSTNTATVPPVYTEQVAVSLPLSPDASVTARKLYRRSAGAGPRLVATITDNTTTSFVDTVVNASLGVAPPASNTAVLRQLLLSSVATGGSLVTSRRIYRTAANASPLKLLTTVADNATTTFLDTLADASLGAAPPASPTAFANQVQMSGIPVGAAAVIARVLYRSIANGSALKLLATLSDNTTTSYLDAVSDASLGAAPPVSDTSGLTQPGSVQVPPGSTSLPVANIGAFQSGGGWAVIGNGDQIIRYHGISVSTLTGIPASGSGAIVAAISWNSTVTAAAALLGIPASGTGSIRVALIKGDEVNLFVQVDDLAARAAIASLLGTDGIIEDYIQDRRLSHREALARGTAQLATKNQVRVELRYTTRDLNMRTGRMQQVNLGAPFTLVGAFLVQSVSERPHANTLMPTFDAIASNSIFTFDEFLRLIHDEVT
jgi:hypothetical protein